MGVLQFLLALRYGLIVDLLIYGAQYSSRLPRFYETPHPYVCTRLHEILIGLLLGTLRIVKGRVNAHLRFHYGAGNSAYALFLCE
jgi:hypothetical protein